MVVAEQIGEPVEDLGLATDSRTTSGCEQPVVVPEIFHSLTRRADPPPRHRLAARANAPRPRLSRGRTRSRVYRTASSTPSGGATPSSLHAGANSRQAPARPAVPELSWKARRVISNAWQPGSSYGRDLARSGEAAVNDTPLVDPRTWAAPKPSGIRSFAVHPPTPRPKYDRDQMRFDARRQQRPAPRALIIDIGGTVAACCADHELSAHGLLAQVVNVAAGDVGGRSTFALAGVLPTGGPVSRMARRAGLADGSARTRSPHDR